MLSNHYGAPLSRIQEHFSRKLAVQKVVLHHEVQNTGPKGAEIHFKINLLMDTDIADWQNIRRETLEGMKKEYCVTEKVGDKDCQPVKKSLNDNGVFLEFNP